MVTRNLILLMGFVSLILSLIAAGTVMARKLQPHGGNEIAFRNYDSNIYVMDISRNQITQLTYDSQNGCGSYSPDGNQIVSWTEYQGVSVMGADGSDPSQIVSLANQLFFGFNWSRNGAYLSFITTPRYTSDFSQINYYDFEHDETGYDRRA